MEYTIILPKGVPRMEEGRNKNGDRLLDVREAADYLGIGQTTLRKLLKTKEIEYHRVGERKIKIKKITLDNYIERKKSH